jgi:hypothetical protein
MSKKAEVSPYVVLGIVAIVAISGFVITSFKRSEVSITGEAVAKGKYKDCATIQKDDLYTTDGELLTTGYSEWGYNYQAHMFNGMYCDYHPVYRPGGSQHEWCQANYGNDRLLMWWNDAWLSNRDCDGDGLLDRHYGSNSYIGSGAWETNHMWGTYESDGKVCSWDYFVKIVAKPTADYVCAGGNEIWGSFCIIQQVFNDPCAGVTGIEFITQPAGFGYYKQ